MLYTNMFEQWTAAGVPSLERLDDTGLLDLIEHSLALLGARLLDSDIDDDALSEKNSPVRLHTGTHSVSASAVQQLDHNDKHVINW
jgi:hypothetical protein